MNQTIRPFPIGQLHNPNAAPGTPYGPALEAILNAEGFESARREISGWPGYAPTPLHRLSGLAQAAGVAEIWYKDEAGRFGLGSFKALGGAYAVRRLLSGEV
ncbi:MAG: diaminopropionate ammonia-lyase, partial [Limibaculum sp.]